jgi:hypothetical protein
VVWSTAPGGAAARSTLAVLPRRNKDLPVPGCAVPVRWQRGTGGPWLPCL